MGAKLIQDAGYESRVQALGGEFLRRVAEHRQAGGVAEKWFQGLVRRLNAEEPFRVQALRLIDVLPALDDDEDLVRHLEEYFRDQDLPLPGLARWGLGKSHLASHAVAASVRRITEFVARRFLGSEEYQGVFASLEELRQRRNFSLDIVGEVTLSEAEADAYGRLYLDLIDDLAPMVAGWPEDALLDRIAGRDSPRLNLSVKPSSLYSRISPVNTEGSIQGITGRLRPILQRARQAGVFVTVDMEDYDRKAITLALFEQLLMEEQFRDWPDVGIAVQAYLKDAEKDLDDLIRWAERRGCPITVRLVRGAYWDQERVIARQRGWPVPVWEHKDQSDACFERGLKRLVAAFPAVNLAVATHNPRSIASALALTEARGLGPGDFELQMLYGMAETYHAAVCDLGYRLRVYLPCGKPIPGMAYLVRRLLENAGSQSIERMSGTEQISGQLLAPPPEDDRDAFSPPVAEPESAFANEPLRRFTDSAERQGFAEAIASVRRLLGATYPLVIDGRKLETREFLTSRNPTDPDEVVGRVAVADSDLANQAVAGARKAFPAWRDRPAAERSGFLRRVATALRQRRDEFAAWEILEAGKGWREADADVCEAIDFLEYYAQEAERLGLPRATRLPGEDNVYFYQPRGVGAVIPPWNFPLAILTGMLAAAVVCGNCVILKPSSQTPVIAARFMDLLADCGLPDGVVQFLPGPGSTVGEHLVEHPDIQFVAFTGSREVGTRILRLAAEVRPGQRHVKKIVAEMGGKNAVIVDSDADQDEAIAGIVNSAFGYQGQKCSACSRVILVGGHYDRFVERLATATDSLVIREPESPESDLGPVIEAAARERILAAVEQGENAGELIYRSVSPLPAKGFFVAPAIFKDVDPKSSLAQEEIFGPVLAVIHAADFTQALAIANDSRYALTGGVYSRSPANLERAAREFQVGNLYLNREITGALVGRQPFGGFRLSGIGSKTGGPDYLLQFLEPRSVTENTLRRGFAPDLNGRGP